MTIKTFRFCEGGPPFQTSIFFPPPFPSLIAVNVLVIASQLCKRTPQEVVSSYQQFFPVANKQYSQNCREGCINRICIVICVLPLRWQGSCCCMLHSHASLLALGAAKPTGDPNHATRSNRETPPNTGFSFSYSLEHNRT